MMSYMRRDDGAVALIVGALMLVLFGSAALTVDLGLAYATRAEVQLAADAGALAGAQELPNRTVATETARNYAISNGGADLEVLVATPYQGNSDRIEVICSRNVDYFFAPLLGFESGEISARAVGTRHTQWAGEALPFINLDDDYTADPAIQIWEKTGPGSFENIDNYTIHNSSNPATVYFTVNYLGGIEVKNGVVATIKQEVEDIFERRNPSTPVYILSLRSTVLASGRVMMVGGSMRDLDKLKNKDLIHPSQLVLLQCTFDAYDSKSKDGRLELTVLKAYDFNAGEFPPNYAGPAGKSNSRLSD